MQPLSGLVIADETPRDGLQNEKRRFSTEETLAVIRGVETGGVGRGRPPGGITARAALMRIR